MKYFQKSLKIRESIGDKRGISYGCYNIGENYIFQGDYSKALEYLKKSLEINIEIGNKSMEALNYAGLGILYLKLEKPKKAYDYSKKAYIMAKEIEEDDLLKKSSEILAKSSEALGLYKEAYKYHVIFKTMSDSLYNKENTKKITGLEYQYKFEKEKQATDLEQKRKDAIHSEEAKQQKYVRNSFIAGFTLMFLLVLIVLRSFLQKKKSNRTLRQQKIEDTNEELSQQKEEIQSQAEELRATNDKLIELDEFKEGMTNMFVHDLKNPLNAIIFTPKSFSVEKQVVHMKQLGKQMLNMVLNILDVHKYEESVMVIDRSDYSLYDLSKNTVDEVNFLAKRKNITVTNQISENIIIQADKGIIERVFVNLLTNAIKYTPNNGNVSISSTADSKSDFVTVSITDTGQGIPKDKIHLVFEKFTQVEAKKSGKIRSTGLGLTFCKIAVEAHGGEIGIESELGKGTRCWLSLPTISIAHYPEKTKTIIHEKTEYELSETEINTLKPYLTDFQNLLVFDTTEIQKIIAQIKTEKNKGIKQWKEEMKNCLYTLNEEKYKELINKII